MERVDRDSINIMVPLVALLFLISATAQLPPDVEVRLTDGSSPMEGRLEVFHQDHWGTVCDDDSFDMPEAAIVCRQLGHSYALQVKSFGPGTGTVLDKLNCNGNEASIMECYHGVFGTSRCDHIRDAGVVCSDVAATEDPVTQLPNQHNNGKLRLVGGPDPYEGRVEVFVYAQRAWVSMCGGDWNFDQAVAVCQKLDYRPATSFGTGPQGYDEGSGPIVNCEFDNDGLLNTANCQVVTSDHPSLNCSHDEDPYVVCSGTEPGKEADLRLVNGSEPTEGRVEIYHQNMWKVVCADDVGLEEKRAICQGLVYPYSSELLPGGFFGDSEKYDVLEYVIKCSESDPLYRFCPRTRTLRGTPCLGGHAAVRCGNWTNAKEGDVRLSGGNVAHEGRVEIYHNGQWGYVCKKNWFHIDNVVCRQLGYLAYGFMYSIAPNIKRGSLTWSPEISCSGQENNLAECDVTLGEPATCRFLETQQLGCDPRPYAESFKARLAGGPYPNQGRVELLYQGVWGTVCDRSWGKADAEVICRQLGFPSAVVALDSETTYQLYGNGSGDILIRTVMCGGSEDNIIKCLQWYQHSIVCQPNEAAGAVCFSEDYPSEDPTDDGFTGAKFLYIIPGVVCGVILLLILYKCRYKCLKSSGQTEMEAVTTTNVQAEAAPGSGYQPVSTNGELSPGYKDSTKSPDQEVGKNEANTAV